MKGTFLITLIVIFSMLVIPLSALSDNKGNVSKVSGIANQVTYNKTEQNTYFTKIKVLKDGEILEIASSDYIFGVVAAEMPALFDKEALKAQAVAAYTFACYRINNPTNNDYHIAADGDTAQCFITREEAAARWGEKAEEYSKKIDDCISEVEGEVLTFEGAPILAAYHAISPGTTNACVDVWGSELPYLKSVESPGDQLADQFLSEATFTTEELTQKLKSIAPASSDGKEYFKNIKTTNNGLVKNLEFSGKKVSGAELCKLLGLRSSNFTINFSDNKFTFTVKGYGHGVGMSQTGADYMAKQGNTYEEILLHYYKGASLQKN